MKTVEQDYEQSNAYSLFVYAVRSQVTRDYYLRRLRIFFKSGYYFSPPLIPRIANIAPIIPSMIGATVHSGNLSIILSRNFSICPL